jgi:hypothetical protein
MAIGAGGHCRKCGESDLTRRDGRCMNVPASSHDWVEPFAKLPDITEVDGMVSAEKVPGEWVRVTPLDSQGRRALWYRTPETTAAASVDVADLAEAERVRGKILDQMPRVVELRAGREGDDQHVVLTEGAVLDKRTLWQIVDALERGREWEREKPPPIESNECTCDLEQYFSCSEEDIKEDGKWEVFDAECAHIAICPSEAYAKLIATVLNEIPTVSGNVCVLHRRGMRR